MINDILYFISDSEKTIIKDLVNSYECETFTILKKFGKSDSKFIEKLLIIDNNNEIINEFETNKFSHLVLNRPYQFYKSSL